MVPTFAADADKLSLRRDTVRARHNRGAQDHIARHRSQIDIGVVLNLAGQCGAHGMAGILARAKALRRSADIQRHRAGDDGATSRKLILGLSKPLAPLLCSVAAAAV